MKEKYVTITGMNHYYGLISFSVGKKDKCMKDKNNLYDSEVIKVIISHFVLYYLDANTKKISSYVKK